MSPPRLLAVPLLVAGLGGGLADCQTGPAPEKPDYETDSLKPFPVLRPVPEYLSRANRGFDSAPSVAVTPGGRIWVAWHAGGKTEDDDNAILVATSGDGGKTWTGSTLEAMRVRLHRFMMERKSPRDSKGEVIFPALPWTLSGGNRSDAVALRQLDYLKRHRADMPVDTVWMDAGWYGAPHEPGGGNCGSTWWRECGDWRDTRVVWRRARRFRRHVEARRGRRLVLPLTAKLTCQLFEAILRVCEVFLLLY